MASLQTATTRVMIISPLSGEVEENVRYAIACVRHSIRLCEEPFAAHLHYPQCLDDEIPRERSRGMACGFSWMEVSELVAVYIDRGFSDGMLSDIEAASRLGKRVEFRKLPGYGFRLMPEHVALLLAIRDEGKKMMPAMRSELWMDIMREGYVFAQDRLQQMAELTEKGREILNAEDLVSKGCP